jgi:CheY-like chemotaxis protein
MMRVSPYSPRVESRAHCQLILKLNTSGIGNIVILTAYAAEDDRRECFEAGCSDYLSKPIDMDELKRVLAKYTAQEK